MIKSTPTKGMRDILPSEMELRNYVTSVISKVYNKYGFLQIETPVLENIELLTGGEGGDNEKMVFKILKRGEKLNPSVLRTSPLEEGEKLNENELSDLGLRFDLTVPLCRFFANNHHNLPEPFKVIQMGSVFRAERPQKGRFRQFTQCDIDVFGSSSPIVETELVLAASEAISELGFKGFTVRINDRRVLNEMARDCGFNGEENGKVFIILDKLDKIGLEGVEKELGESGFSKESTDKFVEKVKFILENEITTDNLLEVVPDLEKKVLESLQVIITNVLGQNDGKYEVKLDLSLVRGMGYYTGPIFEIVAEGLGSSVAGGGRYDDMIGKFIGKEVPACGISIGFERILTILQENGFKPPKVERIAVLYDEALEDCKDLFSLASVMRAEGDYVSLLPKKKNIKNQLDKLQENGFTGFAIYNPGEVLEVKSLT